MSIVRSGKIEHNLTSQEIRNIINEYFMEEEVRDTEMEEMIKDEGTVQTIEKESAGISTN